MRDGLASMVTALLVLGAALPSAAQEPASPPPEDLRITHTAVREQIGSVTRQELCREELVGPGGSSTGMEVICAVIEIPPGAALPKHFHHGLETAYVLEDATIQEVGRPQRQLTAGTVLIQEREVPHDGDFFVAGDKPLRLYTVHVVDKGSPLYNFVDVPKPAPPVKKAPAKKQ
jgi:quercetin dioxygenase-like cupin family protein